MARFRGVSANSLRSVLSLLSLSLLTSALFPPSASCVSTTVVISQVYGAGGLPGAAWQNDYVVLFNNGTTAVNVTGWALQFRPPGGGIWPRVALNGIIAHGHYYLVRLAPGGPFGAPLPPADLVGSTDIDPGQGAIALTNDQNAILTSCAAGPTVVDLVGYGPGMTCSEASPAPPTDPVTAIIRAPACHDSDNNATDFALAPANPVNSGSAFGCNNQAPAIQPIADQTLDEGSTSAFFAVAADANGDAISYGATGPAWFTINTGSGECTLAPDFAAAETNGGVYSASVTASDGFVTSSEGFTITVTDITTAANIPYSGQWPGGVNSHTRELSFSECPDLCLGGPLPLCFGRYYASLLDREGSDFGHLGTNWLGTYDWKVEITPTTETIIDNRGERLVFGIIAGGGRVALNHLDEGNTLTIRAFDNMHRLHRGHQRRIYEFDGTSGLLQKILDEHGNSLTCTYAGGLLSGVADGHGRSLSFTYDASDRLISVGDGTRTVSYGYTGTDLASFTDAASHITTYNNDTGSGRAGLITFVTTPTGTTPLTWSYDADGRVSSLNDAFSNTWAFSVGPGGGCIMNTPTGETWTAIHDTAFRLTSLEDPMAGMTSWTYDPNGRPASVTRPLGDITTLAYDAASGFPSDLGRADGLHVTIDYIQILLDGVDILASLPSAISYPDGTSETFAYDTAGNLVTHTDAAGQDWTATYNANGQPLTMTNPASGLTTFAYDPMLRLASRTDNAGNTTSFAYDGFDRLATLTHPDLTTQTFTYDGANYLVAWMDEATQVWTQGFDANGRIASRTDPLGHSVQYAYDAMDRLTGVTDALGHTATYGYDALGRLTSATDRTSRTTTFAYDPLSRLVTRTEPGGNATTFTYDANGRLHTDTDALGHAMTYEYDALDRVTLATDPVGTAVQYTYDLMGRPTSADAPLGYTQTYGYDPRGLLTSFFDVTLETQFPRTSLGEVGSIRDPNTKVWPFAYDAQGRLTSRTDPLARSTSFTYDNRNRVSHMATPVGSVDPTYDPVGDQLVGQWLDASGSVTLNYTYDAARRLTAATGATFGYDAADRLISSNGLTFTHDDEGRLTSETYAPGKTVSYAYNARGLLSEVTDWLGGTTSFTYDAAGRHTGTTRPNGIVATYQYDSADRLIQKVEVNPGPIQTPLASISLTRDALGRITNVTRNVPLKPTPTASESTGYAYDDAGQIAGMTFDGLGRLTSDGERTFEYDAAGRLTHYIAGAESPTFTYDAFGRMLTRTDGVATKQFVWDYATGTPSLASINPGPPSFAYVVHTPDGLPMYWNDATGARTYYHYDEAGNVIFLTNQSGSVVTSYAYTPTGKAQELGYTADNPFTYAAAAGAIQLGSSGLWAVGPRHYDEVTARCISCPAAQPGPIQGFVLPDDLLNQMFAGLATVAGPRGRSGDINNGSVWQTNMQQGRLMLDMSGIAERPGNDLIVSFGAYVDDIRDRGTASVFNCVKDDIKDVGTASTFNIAGTNPGPIQSERIDPYKSFKNPGPNQSAFVALSDDVINQLFASMVQPGPQQLPADDWSWLAHRDRQAAGPMELLHVSGYRPGELRPPGGLLCSNIPYLDVIKPSGSVLCGKNPGPIGLPLMQQGRVQLDLQQGRVQLDLQQGRVVTDANFNTLYEVGRPIRLTQGRCHGIKGDDCSTLAP